MVTESKDRRVAVMYSPSEYYALQAAARAHGRSVSEHVRHRTIGDGGLHSSHMVEYAIKRQLAALELDADTPIQRHELSNEYTVEQLLRRWLFKNHRVTPPYRMITRVVCDGETFIEIERDDDTNLMIRVYQA